MMTLICAVAFCQTPAIGAVQNLDLGAVQHEDFIPDTALAAQIVTAYPSLRLVERDIDRVRILREWAWSHTNYVNNGQGAIEVEQKDFWMNADATTMFGMFDRNECAVMCGGAGVALAKLYEHFGYRAWGVGHEEIGSFGHTATLVEIAHNGNTILSLQDSSWNVDFCQDGEAIHYHDLLTLLSQFNHEAISVREPDWKLCPLFPKILVRNDVQTGFTLAGIVKSSNCTMIDRNCVEVLDDGAWIITSPRTFSNWSAKKLFNSDGTPRNPGSMYDLVQAGYPANALYWYSRPLWISGPDKAAVLSAARDAAGMN